VLLRRAGRDLNSLPAELWIRIQLNLDLDTDPDPIRIQGFDDQKLKKKNTAEIFKNLFLIKSYTLLMSKATGEAFIPYKRTSSISKN
jgi:hypothetical protein